MKLRIDRETGAPEVAGITREYVEAASVRNEEINRKAREMRERLEAEGERVKWGAGLKQAAAKLNRQGKKYDKAEMERMDAELEEKFGRQAHREAAAIRERGPIVYSQEEIAERAREAVSYGVERAMEREAVADRRQVLADALRRNMLYTTYTAVNDGASSGAPAHFRNPDRVRQTGQVIITEGALKADTAARLLGDRHGVIALAGVETFRDDFGRWLRERMPELRQAVIAFDADAARNPAVRHQLERLGETLWSAGLDARELKWDEHLGKGLDDYLLKDQDHRDEVTKFLRESLASIEARCQSLTW